MINLADVQTTELYWDCECKRNYIKPASQHHCWDCGADREDQPDSIVSEVEAAKVEAGDTVFVPANQATREALVLAVIGEQALVEYTMPAGSSSLRIIPASCPKAEVYRSISYDKLPLKWLKAIDDAGTGPDMVLLPQKGGWQYRVGDWRSPNSHYVSWVDFDILYQSKLQKRKIKIIAPDGSEYCSYRSDVQARDCSAMLF